MNTEFGRLATAHDIMMYAQLQEQRRTNELLERLLQSAVAPAPVVDEPVDEPVETVDNPAPAAEETVPAEAAVETPPDVLSPSKPTKTAK